MLLVDRRAVPSAFIASTPHSNLAARRWIDAAARVRIGERDGPWRGMRCCMNDAAWMLRRSQPYLVSTTLTHCIRATPRHPMENGEAQQLFLKNPRKEYPHVHITLEKVLC